MLIFTGVILMAMLCVSLLAFIIPPSHDYSRDIVSKLHDPIAMMDAESIWAINRELKYRGMLHNRCDKLGELL